MTIASTRGCTRCACAHTEREDQDYFACLVGIRRRKDSFLHALADDGAQQWRAPLGQHRVDLLADDGVLVGEPDAQQVGDEGLARSSRRIERGKEAVELFQGGHFGIVDDGQ